MMLRVGVDVYEACFTLVISTSSHVTPKYNYLGSHFLPSSSYSTCVGLNVLCLLVGVEWSIRIIERNKLTKS